MRVNELTNFTDWNNLHVVLIFHAQELAQDLAQDQSTVKARIVKNFLHILRSQNVMLNKPRNHDENGHEKRSADQDLKCDPIPKKKIDEICKSTYFTLTKYIVCTCVLFPSL